MRYPTEACKLEIVADAALVPHGLLPLQVALLTGHEPGCGVDPLAGGDRELWRNVDLVEQEGAGVVFRHVLEPDEIQARSAGGVRLAHPRLFV